MARRRCRPRPSRRGRRARPRRPRRRCSGRRRTRRCCGSAGAARVPALAARAPAAPDAPRPSARARAPGRAPVAARAAAVLAAAWPRAAHAHVALDCLPAWANLTAEGELVGACPFGRHLPGDVTWSKDLASSAPAQHLLCVLWGYMPYCTAGLAFVELLAKRGTRELQFLCFIALSVGLNEAFLKDMLHQPRPEGSCNVKCGMPSGHATLSIGFLTMIFLDLAFRVCPTDAHVLQQLHKGYASVWHRAAHCCGLLRMSDSSPLSNAQFAQVFAVWLLALAPVPLCRVYLRDHSIVQVAFGGAIGCAEAALWFCLVRRLASRHQGSLGRRWPARRSWFFLRHDYAVPNHELVVRNFADSPRPASLENGEEGAFDDRVVFGLPCPGTIGRARAYAASADGSCRSGLFPDGERVAGFHLRGAASGGRYLSDGVRGRWLPAGRPWRLVLHGASGAAVVTDGTQSSWAADALRSPSPAAASRGEAPRGAAPRGADEPPAVGGGALRAGAACAASPERRAAPSEPIPPLPLSTRSSRSAPAGFAGAEPAHCGWGASASSFGSLAQAVVPQPRPASLWAQAKPPPASSPTARDGASSGDIEVELCEETSPLSVLLDSPPYRERARTGRATFSGGSRDTFAGCPGPQPPRGRQLRASFSDAPRTSAWTDLVGHSSGGQGDGGAKRSL